VRMAYSSLLSLLLLSLLLPSLLSEVPSSLLAFPASSHSSTSSGSAGSSGSGSGSMGTPTQPSHGSSGGGSGFGSPLPAFRPEMRPSQKPVTAPSWPMKPGGASESASARPSFTSFGDKPACIPAATACQIPKPISYPMPNPPICDPTPPERSLGMPPAKFGEDTSAGMSAMLPSGVVIVSPPPGTNPLPVVSARPSSILLIG